MKAVATFFLLILSTNAFSEESVVDIMVSILAATEPVEGLRAYYDNDKAELFEDMLVMNGPIDQFTCQQNHDSMLFDTVACYVSYTKLRSGVVWEFYYFREKQNWIGTNLGLISVIPKGSCIQNIRFKNKLGEGIEYDSVPCVMSNGR